MSTRIAYSQMAVYLHRRFHAVQPDGSCCSVISPVSLDSDSYSCWLRTQNPSATNPWPGALDCHVQEEGK